MASAMATILQWNCRSVMGKSSDLLFLLNSNNSVIAAISETWLKPGTNFRVSGFSCVRDDRGDGYAGCAILIRNSFPYSLVNLSSHDGINAVAVKVNNISYLSVYIPSPSACILRNLKSMLSSVPKPYIVLGDFNCRHIMWGSDRSDTFGNSLFSILDDLDLCVLNTGLPTRRPRPGESSSALDISICSSEVASLLTWTVLDSSYGSDHFPLVISFP